MPKPSWVTLDKSSGTGGGSVQVTSSQNTLTSSRSGALTVRTTSGLTKSVSVVQSGIPTFSVAGGIEFTRTDDTSYNFQCYCTVGLKTNANQDSSVNIWSGSLYFEPGVQLQRCDFSVNLPVVSNRRITGICLQFEDEGSDRLPSRIGPISGSNYVSIDGTRYSLGTSIKPIQWNELTIFNFQNDPGNINPQDNVTITNCNFTIYTN